MLIQVKGLWKVFETVGGRVEALKGIDLNIPHGETLAVVGVSGSGKSTLLHILGTLEHPSEGEITYSEDNVFNRNDREIAAFRNSEIGFVFQFHYLLPEFSALENVMMPCLIKGLDAEQARMMAEDILDKVGLSQRLEHRPGELSGGEQQRVAIARAYVSRPTILIADEPTGNLDPATSVGIMKLLDRINREGTTVVMATHDAGIVDQMRKRVIELEGGHVIRDQARGVYGYTG